MLIRGKKKQCQSVSNFSLCFRAFVVDILCFEFLHFGNSNLFRISASPPYTTRHIHFEQNTQVFFPNVEKVRCFYTKSARKYPKSTALLRRMRALFVVFSHPPARSVRTKSWIFDQRQLFLPWRQIKFPDIRQG